MAHQTTEYCMIWNGEGYDFFRQFLQGQMMFYAPKVWRRTMNVPRKAKGQWTRSL